MEKVMVKHTRTCGCCGKKFSIMIPFAEYLAWEQGTVSLEAFKSLSLHQIHQILANVCEECEMTVDWGK